jgi:ribonucleoside-diphosphate reductase alpha chain
MAKQGSVVNGLMDSFATAISLALQYGVPLKVLVDKFSHVRFEPSGFTNSREIPIAKSIVDYIFRFLGQRFLGADALAGEQNKEVIDGKEDGSTPAAHAALLSAVEQREKEVYYAHSDAPPCHECGSIMVRNGACHACVNCGATSGCS